MVAIAALAHAPFAGAEARYRAAQCDPGIGGGDFSAAMFTRTARNVRYASCLGQGLGVSAPATSTRDHFGEWSISAPPGTVFSYVGLVSRRDAESGWHPGNRVIGTDGRSTPIPLPADGVWHSRGMFGSFRAVVATLSCSGPRGTKGRSCSSTLAAYIFTHRYRFTVVDSTPPTISGVGGGLLSGGPKAGPQSLSLSASDIGGGVRSVFLKVNGQATAARSYRCDLVEVQGAPIATALAPCARSVSDQMVVNTAAAPFRRGPNSVEVCVSDYADAEVSGSAPNTTCTAPRTVNISPAGSSGALRPPPAPTPHPPLPPPPPGPSPSFSCGLGSFGPDNFPGDCWRPYADTSPFNRKLAAPQVASNSQAIVDHWLASWAGGQGSAPSFRVGTADTAYDWDHPLYFSRPTDPVYTVHCTEPWGRCDVEGMQIRIPAQARPAGGDDAHLAVIDQQSGWEYDFWQVRQKSSGVLQASWGGRTRIDGNGLDTNATAAHFGLAAGIIRAAELAAGHIDHALFIVVSCTNGTSVWPAGYGTGSECSGPERANAPAMGQHFFLDMTDSQINALNQPAWKKTILRAMARYGMYVGDTGGGFFKVESGSSYTSFGHGDPWVPLARQLGIPSIGGQAYRFDLSDAVDWRSALKVAAP